MLWEILYIYYFVIFLFKREDMYFLVFLIEKWNIVIGCYYCYLFLVLRVEGKGRNGIRDVVLENSLGYVNRLELLMI